MKPFLLGFAPSVEDSGMLDTIRAYQLVGDNTGNLAFCYAISRLLGGGLKSKLWHMPSAEISRTGDVGVLTLANQLGPHADLGFLVNNFRKLECRLVGIGLGAQAGNLQQEVDIPAGTLDWIREIQERSPTAAPNIAMRGEFSRRSLERYGLADKTVALGCPTLFISPEVKLGKTIAERFTGNPQNIAVTAGHQRWGHLARLEASLVQLMGANKGAYICQSPLEMVQIGRGEAKWITQEQRDLCRNYACPQLSDEEFTKWTEQHAFSFFSAAAWLEFVRRFDFVIGTRIHGVMLALQAGIPGLCIAHDSRTKELCETMKVPHVAASEVIGGIRRDELPRLFRFDPDEFDANRARLAGEYYKFFQNNRLVPAPYFSQIASSYVS
ncbi:polysaccharide pyruvyl transferase family protein [Massilia haematophila]|uniref:Polysaccharide pyruvyl transferase family protein n=1 Tax=Massilia haematophila TaxID=457923 RepID=A0ABV7PMQ3_9BURK